MKLAIDPGHGMGNRGAGKGYDPGAQAGGISEADVTLSWALTLRWILGKAGIDLWLTRDDDSDEDPVATRAARAQAVRCTHFLSIHANAGPETASGVETFYRDSADRTWAGPLHVATVEATRLSDRGVHPETQTAVGRLAVMGFNGPCALVELGYLTNPGDRRVLQLRERRIAWAAGVLEVLRAL